MNHRKHIARLVYWANTGAAWYDMALNAGYEIDWDERSTAELNREARLSYEGRVVGIMHRFVDGEWFAFVWTPEARAPRWREAIWRVTHPLTPRTARTRTTA